MAALAARTMWRRGLYPWQMRGPGHPPILPGARFARAWCRYRQLYSDNFRDRSTGDYVMRHWRSPLFACHRKSGRFHYFPSNCVHELAVCCSQVVSLLRWCLRTDSTGISVNVPCSTKGMCRVLSFAYIPDAGAEDAHCIPYCLLPRGRVSKASTRSQASLAHPT